MPSSSKDLLYCPSFFGQSLLTVLGSSLPFSENHRDKHRACTAMYLLRTLFDSPLSAMVRGLKTEKLVFSQVERSLVDGLLGSEASATSKYFVQSLLRFGSNCEKALRNEFEGPVEKAVFLSRVRSDATQGEIVSILVYEPASVQLWAYEGSNGVFTLSSHAEDFITVEQSLIGSGLESVCFDVQSEFTQFSKRKGMASWDRLLDFAYDLEVDEQRPSVQLLERHSLHDAVFSSLLKTNKDAKLREIAYLTHSESDFEIDAIGWFENLLKNDLTQKLETEPSSKLMRFLQEHQSS